MVFKLWRWSKWKSWFPGRFKDLKNLKKKRFSFKNLKEIMPKLIYFRSSLRINFQLVSKLIDFACEFLNSHGNSSSLRANLSARMRIALLRKWVFQLACEKLYFATEFFSLRANNLCSRMNISSSLANFSVACELVEFASKFFSSYATKPFRWIDVIVKNIRNILPEFLDCSEKAYLFSLFLES